MDGVEINKLSNTERVAYNFLKEDFSLLMSIVKKIKNKHRNTLLINYLPYIALLIVGADTVIEEELYYVQGEDKY